MTAMLAGLHHQSEEPTVAVADALPCGAMLAQGREIADEPSSSANTVKTHLRHLYQKLGARSPSEAVEHARALGVLASSPDPADSNNMRSDT